MPGIEALTYDEALSEANRRVKAGEVVKTFAASGNPQPITDQTQ